MTIATTNNRQSYAGNGVTVAFAFPYYFFAIADLVVYLRSAAGVETLQVLTTNYSITGAADPAGGTVTMAVAPATGETLVIYRDPAATQTADYVSNDPFPAETHERALDKLTMLVQRLREKISKSITFAETSTSTAVTLPDPSEGMFLRWVSGVLSNASLVTGTVALPLVVAEGGTGSTTQAAAFTAIVAAGGTFTGKYADKHGADIASAATLNLNNATGNVIDVTGAVTVTAITLADGAEVVCRFTGAPLLTNGASLVCLGGANVQAAAGDVAVFRGYAASVVRMVQYHRLDGEAINERQATAVASAGTTNLALVFGRYVHVTGTTSITAFGTVPAGVRKTLVFDGILTLTHNATSLIIPGAANVTTAAGDVVEVVTEGSGNWRVLDYTRASAQPLLWLPRVTSVPTTSAQTVNASTTLVDVTGCTIAVASGVRYRYKFYIPHQTDTGTTGVKVSLSGPGATEFSIRGFMPIAGADGVAILWCGGWGSATITPTGGTTSADFGWIEGIIKPSAGGNLKLQFACEVAAGIVTINPGCYVELETIG